MSLEKAGRQGSQSHRHWGALVRKSGASTWGSEGGRVTRERPQQQQNMLPVETRGGKGCRLSSATGWRWASLLIFLPFSHLRNQGQSLLFVSLYFYILERSTERTYTNFFWHQHSLTEFIHTCSGWGANVGGCYRPKLLQPWNRADRKYYQGPTGTYYYPMSSVCTYVQL